MWFLEVYFKDGTERMFCRKTWSEVYRLREAFIKECGEEISKFVDYVSDGDFNGMAVTVRP